MKILFSSDDSTPANPYCKNFFKEFSRFLSLRHSIEAVDHATDMTHGDYDLIIVQDVHAQQSIIEKVNSANKPHIFISHFDNWLYQPVIDRNLLQVFYTQKVKAALPLPIEISHQFNKPVFVGSPDENSNEPRRPDKVTSLIHFHQENDQNLNVLGTIVQFANSNLNVELTIVANKDVLAIVRGATNQNILLKEQSTFFYENSLKSFDLAMTSDYDALKCIMTGIPTMIIGHRGFGGLLSQDNVEDHLKWHFSGRIGGEPEEMIPLSTIQDEFEHIQSNFPSILIESSVVTSKIKEAHNLNNIFTEMERKIVLAHESFKALQSNDYALKPRMTQGVKLMRSPNRNLYHLTKENGKILGAVSEEEMKVISQFRGIKDMIQIAADTGSEVGNVRDFIYELWNEKIICI